MATPIQRATLGVVIATVLIDNDANVAEISWIRDKVRSHGFLENLSDDEFDHLEASILEEVHGTPSLKSKLEAWCAELADSSTAPIAYELALTAMFADKKLAGEEVELIVFLQKGLGLSQEVASALQAVVMSRR